MSSTTDQAADAASADQEAPRTVVWLGNRAAVDDTIDERKAARMTAEQIAERGLPRNRVPIPVPKACTRVVIAPGSGLLDAATDVRNLWPRMSDDPAPAWVASTDRRLAELVADHFGGIDVREPEAEAVESPTGFGPYQVADDRGGEG
jgi:hypothetical protein